VTAVPAGGEEPGRASTLSGVLRPPGVKRLRFAAPVAHALCYARARTRASSSPPHIFQQKGQNACYINNLSIISEFKTSLKSRLNISSKQSPEYFLLKSRLHVSSCVLTRRTWNAGLQGAPQRNPPAAIARAHAPGAGARRRWVQLQCLTRSSF
jgi:hypothetical protein